MRIKLNGQRWTMDKNIQDQSDVQILQLPTAADVAAKYAIIAGFTVHDMTRWRANYDVYFDQTFLDNAMAALDALGAYMADVDTAMRGEKR